VTQTLERNEIASIEWRRVTSIAWPTLSVICALQALVSERPTVRWQILYVAGLITAGLISWALSINQRIQFSNTPTVIYLLVTPILLGTQPKNSWISIGLVAFAAVIYFSAVENIYLAFSLILLITLYQTFVVQLDLSSISDRYDIAYFYSYFSFLWILIMGIASYFIRRRYLDVADDIQEIVDSEINTSINRLNSLKQVNEKDSRNLRLHGTVLNTLIHIRNLMQEGKPYKGVIPSFIREVQSLASESVLEAKRDFNGDLKKLITDRVLRRMDISLTPFYGQVESPLVEESCIEVIRELILNSEKHTEATSGAVTIAKKVGRGIRITFIDNSISQLSNQEKVVTLEKTKESRTLQKLLVACGGEIQVSMTKGKKLRKIEIQIPYIDLELELKATLEKSRVAGLNDFSLNYVRASLLVALLSFPGYLLNGLNSETLIFVASTIIGFFLVLRYPKSKSLLALLIFSGLSIIPSLSFDVQTCADLGAIPWLFNHVITVGFFAAIYIKKRIFRWLPIAILTAECFYYPLHYPTQCQNIFLGSLPGIPLIIVFALSVLAVRRREVYFDEDESLELGRLARALTSSDEYRENAYSNLIQDLLKFVQYFSDGPDKAVDAKSISLQIQKIQTFLVCAEHFDSQLIRKLFELFREKQELGIPGRLTLLGENFSTFDTEPSVDLLVTRLGEIKANGAASLTIVNVHTLELHFEGREVAEKPADIDGIPIFYG